MAIQLIDSYSEDNYNSYVQLFSGSNVGASQSFTGKNRKLTSYKFYLCKLGSPTGNIVAKLYTHSGTYGTSSVPTTPLLATSGVYDIADLTTENQLIEFNFTGAQRYKLTSGTYYCITIEYPGGDGENLLRVGRDSASPTHSGNYAVYVSSWTASSAIDLIFYVYGYTPSGFFIFLCEAFEKGKKYFKKKGLYLPDNKVFKPGILIPEGI